MISCKSFPFFFTFIPTFVLLLNGCGDLGETKDQTEFDTFYPIDFCIVSGNDFDEEGSKMVPYMYVHDGISIKLCCKPCLPKFQKDPQKFLVILEEEMDALKTEDQTDG